MGRKCQHRDASRGRRLLGMTPSSFGHVDPEEVGPVTPLAPVLTTVCLPLLACPLGSHHSLTCWACPLGLPLFLASTLSACPEFPCWEYQ